MVIYRLVACAALLLHGGALAALAQAPLQTSIALPDKSLIYSTTYLLQGFGLFAEFGIRAKVEETKLEAALDAVASGKTDWILISGDELARAAKSGKRLIAIASLLERPQLEIVLKKATAEQGKFDARNPVDLRARLLKGRAFGVQAGSNGGRMWARFVAAKGGLDPDKDVRFSEMNAADMSAALAAGKIDGFSAAPPWTTIAVRGGGAVSLAAGFTTDAQDVTPLAGSLLVTRSDFCATNKALCEKMAKAYIEAARILRDEPARATLALNAQFPSVATEILAASLEAVRRSTPILIAPSETAMVNSENFNVRSGIVKAADAIKNFDGLYTAEFIR